MNPPHEGIYAEPEELPHSAQGLVEDYWKKYNLLSLDGGGIRGYWSLLALGKLMEWIARVEEDDFIFNSFYPQPFPENVSQGPFTDDEIRRRNEADGDNNSRCRALLPIRRYLPCHYFDYICGSSTGALIAIMLGRFRMTVKDCLDEYKNLGAEIFGKPRFFTQMKFGIIDRTKYKGATLERVFKDVTARRSEVLQETDSRILFPSKRGLCKTFVTTMKLGPAKGTKPAVSNVYLIRSYDHDKRITPEPSMMRTPRSTERSGDAVTVARDGGDGKGERNINYGNAQTFETWEVARAASAAPFYFEPMNIELAGSSGRSVFIDGGFNYTNNPTEEGTQDIEDLYGANSIGVVVSVGTSRKDSSQGAGLRQKLKDLVNIGTNPEMVHRQMEAKSERERFPYFRLNHPDALSIELDEWKPKQTPFTKISGSKTIQYIEDTFARWAGEVDNLHQLQLCARELVRRRRDRAKDVARWERYAIGAQFRCRYKKCEREDFVNRGEFKDHLLKHHAISESGLEEEADECRKYWRYQRAPNR